MKDKIDKVEEFAQIAQQQLSEAGYDLNEQAKKAAESSIEIAKKYPLHTAVGAATLGLIVGLLINKRK